MMHLFFPDTVAQKSIGWKKFKLQWGTIAQKKISNAKTHTT